MKHLLLYLFVFFGFATQAQPTTRQEKIEALYVAYITRELNLREGDAKKFWPVHAQYDAEIRAVKETNEIDRQQTILNIKKRYQDRFIKILGADRTNTFFVKDAEFRKRLVERLKNMRQHRNQQNLPLPRNGMN